MQVIQKIKFLLHRSLISGSSDPGPGNRLRCSRNNYIKNQRNIRIIGSVSLVLLLAISTFTLRPISAETSSAEATANPSTTTLTVETSDSTATLDITPTSPTGTFSSSDTSGTSLAFNVSTNNITGYNLSISHESATTPAPLVNEDLNNSSTSSNSSSPSSTSSSDSTNSTILSSLPTGTSISDSEFSDSTYVGYYGYKPSKLNSFANSNYIPAPTTTSTTINVTECANNTTNCNTASDEYTIALGANIDYTKPAGTYTNTFILAAVANNVPYTINYLDNTGEGGTTGTDVSNLPDPESSSTATATNFTLSSTIPTRTGYTFAGWCYGIVTHNATGNDTCTTSSASGSSAAGDGTTYQPDSTFSFANYTTSTNVANLYAMWNVKTFTITLSRSGGASGIVIDGTTYTGTSVTLTYGDHTISGTYDSNYEFSSWSTSNATNLSISSTSSASTTITVHGAATLTLNGKQSCTSISGYMQDFSPTSSTCDSGTLTDRRDNQEYLVGKLADGKWWLLDNLRLGASTLVETLSTSNTNMSSSVAFTLPASSSSGFSKYSTAMINTAYANTTTTSYGSGSGKIGVYYNYCAASAGTYCMASGSGSGNASYDVCPAGWRMPTGGSNGEYQALYTAYSSNATNFRNALSTPLSGYFGSSASDQGSYGDFWSSTHYDGSNMYYLRVDSSNVGPRYYYYGRAIGYSVRCVLKSETIADATNMQTVTSAEIANSTEGETTTLKDVRDNQDYTVAKINGNLWMTKNLAIGCNSDGSRNTVTLTSSDSNVSSNYTLSASDVPNFDSSNNSSTSGYTTAAMMCSSDSSYGAWYNYKAATAGTITGSSNSTDASKDICPAGWRLPTRSEQSGIISSSSAFSPVTGGTYYGGSISSINTRYGFWWSTTANGSTNRNSLYWNGSSMRASLDYRYYGFYVRCIRKSTIDDATYMQDVTAEMVADTEEGATATLRDKRDEQEYTVAKINGNLWMTQNLRFSGSTIDPTDTNIDTTKTISWGDLTSGNSYDAARYHNSGNTTNGYWYNYAGASAMTITGSSNQNTQTYDICPKNWRLPTLNEFSGITSPSSAFSPVTGGYYDSGSSYLTGYGYWWSATAYNSTNRYYLFWDGSSLNTYDFYRTLGFYVRCIRSS